METALRIRCAERICVMQLVCICESRLVPGFHRTFESEMIWAQVRDKVCTAHISRFWKGYVLMDGCEECIYMKDSDCIRGSGKRRAERKCEHYVNRMTCKSYHDAINELAELLLKERQE